MYYSLISSMSKISDAEKFIIAAGITDATQKYAINTLVNDLKSYGIWSKMKAIYPIIGGSASSHKFNLKDPRDLDAAFRLTFAGGWTHSSNGAKPNGTNAYADSFLIPSISLTNNNYHLSHYSRTLNITSNSVEIGSTVTDSTSILILHQYYASINAKGFYASGYPTYSILNNLPKTLGFQIGSRISNISSKLYYNGLYIAENTTLNLSTLPAGNSLYIAANHNFILSSAIEFSDKETSFVSIGDGLTDTEAANLYNIVENYQTILNRQVNIIVSDADAQAFINAASIIDINQANAINTFVISLKSYGIWSKMKAIYPFVGGTATAHKFNLKDPRDLNAAFRLTFAGGGTHSLTGYLPNGTNAYANTNLNSSINLTSANNHISVYSRTNPATINSVELGVSDLNGYYSPHMRIRINGFYGFVNTLNYVSGSSTNQAVTNSTNTDSRGHFIGNILSTTNRKTFKNGSISGTNTNNIVNSLANSNIYIAALNVISLGAGFYTNREIAFSSIGDGLTDTEAANYYTAIQNLQTTLGRQV